MKYKTIDLCAGIGGIRRGFELTGHYENIKSAENDLMACKTYQHLFNDNPLNDVTSDDFKQELRQLRYDVLMAGFPCQAFSRVGKKAGFEDKTKGTIFFDIAKIIEMTVPKAVFLENVENLVNHDKGNTFRTIIETLEIDLNYKVIGVNRRADGSLDFKPRTFICNSKNFGMPQNRPRVYIIAFSRAYFGQHVEALPNKLPLSGVKTIYHSVEDILDKDVSSRFFLSEGYLETLEKHKERQQKKGYGFGYRIVNAPGIKNPIANTLLATGGSGRERNLIYDKINGPKYAKTMVKGKYSPVNSKNVRTMTPNEWGKLQGFVNYAFINESGQDEFSFPDGIPNVQRYKQFGNSVTIPVIETMAEFIFSNMSSMKDSMTDIEQRLFTMYGDKFLSCLNIYTKLGSCLRNATLHQYFNMVYHFGCNKHFRNTDIAKYLNISSARASQIIKQLLSANCISKAGSRTYSFIHS